jgi:hypothetical protein
MVNIVSPSSIYRGRSYGEWGAKWWQWAYSVPKSKNPVLDQDGQNSHEGQKSGPVWFLAATYGEGEHIHAQRNCPVPAGKAIFVPILNVCFNNMQHGEKNTELDLLDMARSDIDSAIALEASVDGENIRNLHDYRAESPLFSVHAPAETSRPAGGGLPALIGDTKGVSDGYWLLFEPLPVGPHTVRIRSKTPTFSTGADYNLHVSANFKSKI